MNLGIDPYQLIITRICLLSELAKHTYINPNTDETDANQRAQIWAD